MFSSAAAAAIGIAGTTARGDTGPRTTHGAGDLSGIVLYCSTDTVTLSGTFLYTQNGFVDQLPDGSWLSHGTLSFHLEGVTGTGTSGTSYRVVGASQIGYGFAFGSSSLGRDVEHSTETWQLVPIGGGKPLTFHENFVFVVTPSDSTMLVDHGPSDCG
jgi:hypothetical protein